MPPLSPHSITSQLITASTAGMMLMPRPCNPATLQQDGCRRSSSRTGVGYPAHEGHRVASTQWKQTNTVPVPVSSVEHKSRDSPRAHSQPSLALAWACSQLLWLPHATSAAAAGCSLLNPSCTMSTDPLFSTSSLCSLCPPSTLLFLPPLSLPSVCSLPQVVLVMGCTIWEGLVYVLRESIQSLFGGSPLGLALR